MLWAEYPGNTAQDWYKFEASRKKVLGELAKSGKYFVECDALQSRRDSEAMFVLSQTPMPNITNPA